MIANEMEMNDNFKMNKKWKNDDKNEWQMIKMIKRKSQMKNEWQMKKMIKSKSQMKNEWQINNEWLMIDN